MTEASALIRKCVHCGFCNATCPTYLLTGDELDGPRGRIWLMKDMLATPDAPPSPRALRHLDRCLTCLSCTTTCPSGVDYAQLIDHARAHAEPSRPWPQRITRRALTGLMSRRRSFRAALHLGRLARPLAPLLPARLQAMLALVPARVPLAGAAERDSPPAPAKPIGRVILHLGCVQPALRPQIDDAALRLLTRHGLHVIITRDAGCCGALHQHLGQADAANARAAATLAEWRAAGPVDAIITTTSGCGSVMKTWADPLSAQVRDISEYLATLPPLPSQIAPGTAVAWHNPCSLQHGQRVTSARELLVQAGFDVRDLAESHLCCGSAGTYALLQPELSGELRLRKQAHVAATGAPILASSNIGCLTQLASPDWQAVHVVELLDWASGGPNPLS
ncbi:glycolate oxidase subunit GlcF [Sandarakinorhabdus oryzae]|uniref:glycolate oxidase subunit GlcF n=1 Tax=Sandarakinorhabdus oryzae TaxID=2675220 RepID=UPI0012E1324E|nr:glycolate oxidase subunit GlcF [Sandarakinorhabdus oryzae]